MNTPGGQAPETRSPEENEKEQAMMTAIDKLMQSGGYLFLGSEVLLKGWLESEGYLQNNIPKTAAVLFLSGNEITVFLDMLNDLGEQKDAREKYKELYIVLVNCSSTEKDRILELTTDREVKKEVEEKDKKTKRKWDLPRLSRAEGRGIPSLAAQVKTRLALWGLKA